ncbi:MAG TPA: hypothetical protein VFZ66_11635 [Herpetosiphonaceae bacterium]
MNLQDLPILDQLAEISNHDYSYIVLAAIAGPLTLRVFGFKLLSQLIRPLALIVLLGGMYAKQQRSNGASHSA